MKLRGEFVLRQIADDILAIPVGAMALELSGMVILNPVSKVIWQCLERETDLQTICKAVTDRFEVTPEEARQDAEAFLCQLRGAGLLQE
jgi:hypothetical protein